MNFGDCVIGIELGSTRIKAVLVNGRGEVLASGSHSWENRFENGLWTYSHEDILSGLRSCYSDLKNCVKRAYGQVIERVGAIGISAMMHGYLAFDGAGGLLVPFRTWRNNNAEPAAKILTEEFNEPVPARWSVAHLYQAILNGEPHVKDIKFLTTLDGFVHYLLTGEKVLGIDSASGTFPVDYAAKDYDGRCIEIFERLARERGADISLRKILPEVMLAGERAGFLTKEGALLLDGEGDLRSGIPFCPPEGDAATGMVATDAVRAGTGNVSAGTSVFATVVLKEKLKSVHPEIDVVSTPSGEPAAMAHCNNCTSDLNAWAGIFSDFAERLGVRLTGGELFNTLFNCSLEGDGDCGEVICYNYVSGENITRVNAGRPLVVRKTESSFTLANFMRSQIYSAIATLRIGLDILTREEGVEINSLVGHGGLFKTEKVAQQYLADAVKTPVTVMKTAGEGGAWGMALLALYMLGGAKEELCNFLDREIFSSMKGETLSPSDNSEEFEKYLNAYKQGLPVVRKAAEVL